MPSAGTARMAEDLLLLTHDDSLIEALTGVVAQGCLTVVPDEAALGGALMSGRAGVVFIDAGEGAAQAAMAAPLTQRLHSEWPDVVLVVAGDGAAQSELAPLVTDGTIYRFVHKPVSAQRVKLFVDAAWRKRDGTSSGASGLYPTLSMSQTMEIMPMARPVPWLGITAAAAVVGVALAWYALNSTRPAPQIAAPEVEHTQAAPVVPAVPATPAATRALAPAAVDRPAAPITPQEVRITARRHPMAAIAPGPRRVVAPVVAIPDIESVTISVPTARLLPVVAASAATIADASISSAPGGAPSSTPPVGEAKDPLSVAAIILERVFWVDPEFPEIARDQDLTGFVDLEFMVHADGSVTDVTVLKAQPVGIFEKTAVLAVRQWRYRPVERDGMPVDAHARLRLNFGYK